MRSTSLSGFWLWCTAGCGTRLPLRLRRSGPRTGGSLQTLVTPTSQVNFARSSRPRCAVERASAVDGEVGSSRGRAALVHEANESLERVGGREVPEVAQGEVLPRRRVLHAARLVRRARAAGPSAPTRDGATPSARARGRRDVGSGRAARTGRRPRSRPGTCGASSSSRCRRRGRGPCPRRGTTR